MHGAAIQRLREAVQRAVVTQPGGAAGNSFVKQLTVDEAMCLICDYEQLLGEVQVYREHFAKTNGTRPATVTVQK